MDALQIPVTTADFETIERFQEIDTEIKIHTKQMRAEKKLIKKYGDLSTAAQKRYDIMKFWEHAFSEAGLIKYVIRHILEYLNERCNSYLSTLSKGNFVIKFDDSLDEQIYNKGAEVHFDSLSGGEKKRVSQDNPLYTALRDKMLFKDLTEEQKDLLATADKGVRKRVAGQVRQDLVDEGTFDPETFSFRK